MESRHDTLPIWWRLVRFGFRLLYNEMAWTYDLVSWVVSLGAWRCWGRAALKHIPSEGAILELAHGTGNLQLDLHAAGRPVIGFDLSAAMGRITWRKLVQHGYRPRLVRGRAQTLPFRSGAFSTVISTFPTDFIVAPETLHEIHRVLQPGGRLVIVPTALFTGGGVFAKLLDFLYRITGQRGDQPQPAWDVAAMFAPYGFSAQMVQETCPRSRVTVIVAEKRG